MKVYLNLAVTPSRRERYALAWALPVFVAALAVLVYLGVATFHDYRRSRQLSSSLESVRSRDSRLRSQETELRLELGRPKFQKMLHETDFVNHLIDQRHFSLTELTLKVGKLLPANVKLNGLGLAGQDSQPEVQFAVMGKDEKAIESFLSKLEDSKDFSNVTIKNQGFRKGTTNGAQQVALICTAQYLGVAPSAP